MIRFGGSGWKAQLLLRVVAFNQVFDDCSGLPESEVRVGIMDGGNATVGVDSKILGLLHICEWDSDDLVWDFEF